MLGDEEVATPNVQALRTWPNEYLHALKRALHYRTTCWRGLFLQSSYGQCLLCLKTLYTKTSMIA